MDILIGDKPNFHPITKKTAKAQKDKNPVFIFVVIF